ncbi:HTH-type transcriptional regulator DmlR [Andreprevotia sp. IGB-42]|uniref:LysR substrate-binding domain-containing protein n=1 Tax=Andreprevotia sp. IGB-42 TaxID=2497473 RepID=UPI0013578769|nr:LysR substrate-binding domain-containing protein [Andreprevotia sp. IGB-42]KAF0813237.1 HTH-type transcriptional regulator DmlR [Andreprevotia sp. IGB-42]
MQDVNDMLFFAEVIDHGGFAAAGRALGIPKSRLSRRIAELEAALGVRLLQRTTRKLALTDLGERYYRHCVVVRDEANAAREDIEALQAEPRGIVRVSCPVTLAQFNVGPLLPEYLAAHPQVRLQIIVTNRPVDLIEEGIDIALRVRPTPQDSATLVVKTLGENGGYLVASPAQLLRQGTPKNLDELGWLDTVAMSATDGRASWTLLGPDGEKAEVNHQPRFVIDDLQVLREAVLGGIGAAVLPAFMVHTDVWAGRLVRVLPEWNPPAGLVHAVFPSRRGLLPAVRTFLDFLGEKLPQQYQLCQEIEARQPIA